MSELLKAFYLAYAAWLDDGAPTEQSTFSRKYGLCANVRVYARNRDMLGDDVENELRYQLIEAGLDYYLPFNSPETNDYWDDVSNEVQHLNPKRIAWVRNQVEKIKAEQ